MYDSGNPLKRGYIAFLHNLRTPRLVIPSVLVAVIFAVMVPIGNAFRQHGLPEGWKEDPSFLLHTAFQLLGVFLGVFLVSILFYMILDGLQQLLKGRTLLHKQFYSEKVSNNQISGKADFLAKDAVHRETGQTVSATCGFHGRAHTDTLGTILREHPLLVWLFFFVLSMLLFWIIYPGILMGDTSSQISEAFGAKAIYAYTEMEYRYPDSTLTAMHPILSTFFLKGCMLLGYHLFHSYNVGLGIAALVQSAVVTYAFAGSCQFLARQNVRTGFLVLYIILLCINPLVLDYVFLHTKDTLFTAFLLLFLIRLYPFLAADSTYGAYNQKSAIRLTIVSLGVCAFRGEGFYLVLVTLLVAGLSVFIRKRRFMFPVVLSIGIVLLAHILMVSVAYPLLHVTPAARSHQMTIPMQQVARYVLQHPEELTDEEKAVITAVISLEELRDGYDPEDADGVKMRFDLNASQQELQDFLRIWLQMCRKDPSSAILVWLNTKYEYFYLGRTAISLYRTETGSQRQMNWLNSTLSSTGHSMDLHYPEVTADTRIWLDGVVRSLRNVPIYRWILHPALYVLVLFWLTIYFFARKIQAGKLLLLPLWLVFLITDLCSAVNASYGRYLYPLIVLLPFAALTGLCRKEGMDHFLLTDAFWTLVPPED